MRALTHAAAGNENGGAMAEATDTAVSATSKGAILTSDARKSSAAREQRQPAAWPTLGLVRFLTDFATEPTNEPIVVVIDCPDKCGRYFHPRVRFDASGDPTVTRLPGNCPTCGAMVDTVAVLRDVIATARNYGDVLALGKGTC